MTTKTIAIRNETITGDGGNDNLNGGAGNDTMDGGAGSDRLNGGIGDDTLVYRLSENAGSTDVYIGGAGIDTVLLKLTQEEYSLYGNQISSYEAHLNTVKKNPSGEVSNGKESDFTFHFGSAKLTVSMMEVLKVEVTPTPVRAPTLQEVPSGSVAEVAQSPDTTDSGLTGTLVGAHNGPGALSYGITGGTVPNVAASDTGDVAVVSNTIIKEGAYGTLTLDTVTGAYSYTKNNAAIEALDDGERASDVFTVTASNGSDVTAERSYVIDITGADDAPTLAAVTAGFIAEVTQDTATIDSGLAGTLQGEDVDGEMLTYGIDGATVSGTTATLAGTFGTLTLDTVTGSYSYTKNNAAIEALDDGETGTDAFTVTVSDGDGAAVEQTYTINIAGADDAPTLEAVASGSVTENVQSNETTDSGLSGTLAGADVDRDALTYGIKDATIGVDNTVTRTGTYGTLTLNTLTGSYSYTKDIAAIEALDDGETGRDVFTVTVNDGDGADIEQNYVVDVTGADDAPTLDAITDGTVAENTQSASTTDAGLSGRLAGNDVDGDALTYGIKEGTADADNIITKAGIYGTLSVNAITGDYSYTKNIAAIEALDDGETGTDAFTVTVSDGDGAAIEQTYTINIAGADDAPVLATVASGSIAEMAQSAATVDTGLSGTLEGEDVDGETLTYGISGATVAGSTATLAGAFGTLTVNTLTGSYSYTKDIAAIEALDDGETGTDAFTVTVSDGDGAAVEQTYTINIAGADDAPVLATVASGSITEVAQSAATVDTGLSGTLKGEDVDGETLTYGISGATVAGSTATLAGAFGTLSLDTVTGSYSYTKNNAAIEALDDGETGTDSFTVTVSDGDGAAAQRTYTVNVAGADDAPTLAAVTPGSIVEESLKTSTIDSGLSGKLTGNDVDGDTLTYGIDGGTVTGTTATKTGTYGTLTVNTVSGDYSYAKNTAAIEALNAGQTGKDEFNVTVNDGDGPVVMQKYVVDITGANETIPATLPSAFTGAAADPNDFDSKGLAGPNTISGTRDGDTLYGGTGADTIRGDSGNDAIYGGSGNDTIYGDQHDDKLYGGSGADVIYGGNGADTIVGGFGADELTGGPGNDTFVFLDIRDTNDTITDFSSGDKLDLRGLVPTGSLAWGGQQSGPIVQTNSVTWYGTSTNVVVLADTNGNVTNAEFMVTLQGVSTLTQNDFIL